MNHVFITGGAGFIGQAFARSIAERSLVTIYDNLRRSSSDRDLSTHPNIRFVVGDIRDTEKVSNAMKEADVVVHAAAVAGINTVSVSPIETMDINFGGTASVLRAASEHTGLNRIVLLSTSEVFGPMAEQVTEEDSAVIGPSYQDRWIYAASKVAGEHLAFAYARDSLLPIVVVRPFNVYGPRQIGEGAIKMFTEAALRDLPLNIYGAGEQVRSWCYIDDFVVGLHLCVTHPKAIGKSFNIGNPDATVSVLELAQKVIDLTSSRSDIEMVRPLDHDVYVRIPDINRARTVLGFNPRVSLNDGLMSTIEHIRNYREIASGV